MYHLNREIWPEGSYYILEKLEGEGQTATVYRAIRHDRRGHSRQTVALKILKNGTSISTLRREFEALARVSSPHCVRVLGWENLSEGPAVVLEWVDGVSLLKLSRHLEFSSALVNEVIAQVQSGLKALQSAGLNHGDLSPANILIDRTGCVRLIDFSTDFDFSNEQTHPDPEIHGSPYIRGTPAFLAPEVWNGSRPNLKSDLFSLGVIAHDLKSGFFSSPSDATICRARLQEIDRLESSSKLLNADPEAREFLSVESDVEARSCLADGVTSYLQQLSDLRTQSLPIQDLSRSSSLNLESAPVFTFIGKFAASIAAIMVASVIQVVIPVQAEAPPLDQSIAKASLSIHTNRWFFAELNGKTVGYAPIVLHELAPGEHRLTWRTKGRHGELRVNLAPGGHLKLTEETLLK